MLVRGISSNNNNNNNNNNNWKYLRMCSFSFKYISILLFSPDEDLKLLQTNILPHISGWELTVEIYNVIIFIYQQLPTKVICLPEDNYLSWRSLKNENYGILLFYLIQIQCCTPKLFKKLDTIYHHLPVLLYKISTHLFMSQIQ